MIKNKREIGSLSSGHFSIFKLLEFAASNPIVPVGRGGVFAKYRKITNELTSNVPRQPGWYWWGKFDENSNWQTTYLGKSENRQTSSLHARISEELNDERISVWSTVFGQARMRQMQHEAYGGRYDKLEERGSRKSGTHFIIWISDPDAKASEIIEEEKRLIQSYKPAANKQRVVALKASNRTTIVQELFKIELGKIITTKN
jgi:hypothetical protein